MLVKSKLWTGTDGDRTGLLSTVSAGDRPPVTIAHETEDGRAVLEPFQTTKFDEFPEGIETAEDRMRMMMELVQDIPQP